MKTSSLELAEQKTQAQNLTLLKVYSVYRLILAAGLLFSFYFFDENRIVGNIKPTLFIYAGYSYLIINMLSCGFILPRLKPLGKQRLFLTFFVDIVAILLIVDSTGGVKSGLGILLVVIIAASSIVITGQIATLLAAIASIFLLADTFRLIAQNYLTQSSIFPSGVLGLVLFATSFFIQSLSQRMRKSQLEAEQSAAQAQRQERLNQLIVQRMQTGIIVTDNSGRITTSNQAAKALLNNSNSDILPPVLFQQLSQWLSSPSIRHQPFKTSESGPEVQANFSGLDNEKETLIFLEDNRQITQRAQDIKLASLGRLTASIAHEIRNPLGAISHAAQLLKESTHLADADLRLSGIIQNHCQRMNQVIENILQLSRRKAPSIETINLNEWLEQFIIDFTQHHPDAVIRLLSLHPNCLATVDESQLQQVLSNLMENGIRYSKKKTGQGSLQLIVNIDDNKKLPYLDIVDDGEGISSEQQSHLFEPFFTTESSGTGLGLFIAREMCEANQIRLDYLINNGKSTFRLSFSHHEKRLSQHTPLN
ncbi:ATP-binding protein [Dasania sp. GY-MA-18]|uniref:histidine kinase n=1 Tax=Dasania phycosphaerae TaxID=2950436 RepID=A0A9J6RNC2_9GAMM|nr:MULTISPECIES: ATP-binding protein [Dasania]MCR8923593.1 ATP-binding protein [Dasania sp. GY-MA-18]MCZ0866027.1 ATP-binding protein [Dasania phycosphaerae]MCZ0869751.1 ATP-binding protein [Dasania phycosphaerae]